MLTTSIKQALVALAASLLLMLALGLAFYAGFFMPAAEMVLSFFILFFEIWAPFYILEKWEIRPDKYNIYAHRLELLLDNLLQPFRAKKSWPDGRAIAIESLALLKMCLFVLVPYATLYLGYTLAHAHLFDTPLTIGLNFPPNLGLELLTQIGGVALPEEIFFRGFLQGALLKAWPNHFFIKGMPLGRAILITNAIFALSHFVGGFFVVRLLTFFPGLLFSYLVYKNKSIYSAVLFHAICNITGQMLYLSLQIG